MLMGLNAPLASGLKLALEIDTSTGVIPILIPITPRDEASLMAVPT